MKIKFLPTGQEIEGDPNKSLLKICTENKIEIKSICKGVPSCAECRVKIVSGEYNVLPPSKAEISLIGSNYFIDQRRLACQLHCFGDVVVDIGEQIERGETQNKKVRGFRLQNQKGTPTESHAKQGILVLEENAVSPPPAPASNSPGQGQRHHRSRNRRQKK
jgi:2Fe-2S ferredoxin